MDIATLRAIYTATSTDFDRVTDHVQRRLKETQAAAGGLSGATQAVSNEVRKIESTLTSRAPVKFLGIDVAGEKRAAAEVVNTARDTVNQVEQATSKFNPAAFWARQSTAATTSSKTVETEAKRAAASVTSTWTDATAREERLHARRATSSARTTATVVRDAKTGATLTQAELTKILGGASKAVDTEAKRVSHATRGVLHDLQTLFLRNNFLFRQLGQRVAGDLGFAAVGAGKLAINFQQLATASGGAGAGLSGVTAAATSALGAFAPLGITVGIAVGAIAAVEIAAIAASAGLFLVAKSVSDTEQRFADLNRQTGLSTDNLQVLDIASQQAGTKLDRIINSVGQLQRKLIDASEGGTSRFSVGLKKLGIDLEDPNRALNQLIDLLGKLPAGTVRTGAALQIFGRGGREVVAVIDQITENVGNADGALDRFKKQLQDAGVRINSDGVETASNFHKQLILLEAQFNSIKRVVGEEALPAVLRVATDFSNWIARNRVELGNWARDLVHVAERIVELGVQLGKLARLAPIVIPIIPIVQAATGPGAEIVKGIGQAIGSQPALPGSRFSPVTRGRGPAPTGPARFDEPGEFAIAQGRPAVSTQTADDIAKRIRDAFAPRTRGGGRGEDPAQTARRLAEITLQETLRGLQAEHDALQRALDQNLISRDRYTQDAVNLELKRRQATLDGLRVELAEAEKIRKPGQRAIRVAEINARIRDEERRTSKEITQITDESAAEQLRIGQSLAQSELRIIETQTERLKARIRDYADFRIITERQAAAFEEQQTLRVFNARERILRQELRDAGANAEKRAEAQARLNELEEERRSFTEENSRRIERAIHSDAEHVIRFAAEIRDAFQRARDVRLEAGEADLEPLRNSILTRHQLWDAELQFEITREEQRHDAVVSGLNDEAALARIRIKNAQELAQVLTGIRAQETAEEELHQARLRQLATQAREQRRQELLQVADDLASIASDVFDAIGQSSEDFWKSLAQTASNFAKQLRDQLFKGLLERAITGQAQGAEGLIGAILNPLLRATGPNAAVSDNTKATEANTAAINALTSSMGGAPAINGGLSGVYQLLPGLFGGSRASGGPVSAGRVYQIHDNEFFRPNLSGQILNLNQAQGLLGGGRDEVRLNVAVGQDAVSEMIESHSITPKGRRAMLVRAKYNRKVGKLLFA